MSDKIWVNGEWVALSGDGGEGFTSAAFINEEELAVDDSTLYFLGDSNPGSVTNITANGNFISKALVGGEGSSIVNFPGLIGHRDFLSQDGISWNLYNTNPKGISLAKIVRFKEKLYAVSTTNVGYKSNVNASVFEVISTLPSAKSIACNSDYLFFTNASTRLVYRTSNGVDFTSHSFSTPIPNVIQDIACSDSVIVIVGASSTSNIAYSLNNGDSWTGVADTQPYSTVEYLNGKFYAFGVASRAVSEDGINWTSSPSHSTGSNAVYADGKIFSNPIYLDLDNKETTKNLREIPTLTSRSNILMADGDVLIALVRGGTNPAYYRTSLLKGGGSEFDVTPISGLAFTSTTNMNPVAYFNGTTYMVICGGTQTNVRAVRTTDFSNWTTSTSLPNQRWNALIYQNTVWVAAGSNAAFASGTIYTSPDGGVWTQRTISGTNVAARRIDYDGTTFIGVGGTGVVKSTNGINWTGSNPFGVSSMTSIVYALGRWVVCTSGNGNRISTDGGDTWSSAAGVVGGTTINYLQDSEVFIISTTTGQIYTSSDLVTWTSVGYLGGSSSVDVGVNQSCNFIESDGVWYSSTGHKSSDGGVTWIAMSDENYIRGGSNIYYKTTGDAGIHKGTTFDGEFTKVFTLPASKSSGNFIRVNG